MKKISIVITGRDDDYGNDPHKGLYNLSFKPKSFIDRMYYTVSKNLKLFKKYFYDDFEIVIVDWSPLSEKYLYQNENLEKLLFGKDCIHLKTPKSNAFTEIDSIFEKLNKNISNDKYNLIITAMGCSGRVLQKRIYNSGTYAFVFDFGSLLDALAGWNTRAWIELTNFDRNNFLEMLEKNNTNVCR